MLRTAISIKFLATTANRPARLKASTMSARPVSATVTFFSPTADCEDARYLEALHALLRKLGDGWGDIRQWLPGSTNEGRVYIRAAVATDLSGVDSSVAAARHYLDKCDDPGHGEHSDCATCLAHLNDDFDPLALNGRR